MTATLYTFAATSAATFRQYFGDVDQFDMQVGEQIDPTLWSVTAIDYPGAHLPYDGEGTELLQPGFSLLTGCQQGAQTAINAINAMPGKFGLVGYSQGSFVAWLVYLATLPGGQLASRANDLLGAVTFGSPVREAGHTIPGGTDPGGHGCYGTQYRATNTPTLWWDFADVDPLDPFTTTGDDLAGQDFTACADVMLTASYADQATDYLNIILAALPNLSAQIPAIWQDLTEMLLPFLSPNDNTSGHGNYNQTYQGLPNNTLTAVQLAVNYLNSAAAAIPGAGAPAAWPTVIKRYPSNPITPAGAYYFLYNKTPVMRYRSYDDTTLFDTYGGPSIYDHTTPESVQVLDMKGLVPPWQKISQKGATQDGETFVTSLYDPIEVEMTVRCRGRDAEYTRAVVNDWIASWDAIEPGELSWFTQKLGRWWAQVRWSKAMADKVTGGNQLPQTFIWSAIAYDAFWRSYDTVDTFTVGYTAGSDNFARTSTQGLGTNWNIGYSSPGGWLYTSSVGDLSVLGIPIYTPGNGGMVQWAFDPANPIGDAGVDAVAINNTYTSETDDQVVSITIGSIPSWDFYGDAYNDIWARTPTPGTGAQAPGQSGIRLRFGIGTVELSYFINGAKTVLRQEGILIPPLPGEIWTLACSGRSWTVTRGSSSSLTTVFTCNEIGANSPMGPSQRCAGLGVHAVPDGPPASVLSWSAGDNVTTAQSGYVTLVNFGDQPMFWRATVYGPGTFTFGDGPNATDFITLGPLENNQIVQVRTDPGKRGVVALTPPPDGQPNVYSLLDGRFSDDAAIPKKPVAGPVQEYQIPVSIAGGNAASKIIAAGTPLRRFPYG